MAPNVTSHARGLDGWAVDTDRYGDSSSRVRNSRCKVRVDEEDDEIQIRVPRGSAPPVSRKWMNAKVGRSASADQNNSMCACSPNTCNVFQPLLSPLEQSVIKAGRSPSPVLRARPQSRSNTIRLGSFSGHGTSLSTHLAKLDNCTRYYGWDEMERVCHLRASLDGVAATVLWQAAPDICEADLVKLLKMRFDDTSLVELHRASLHAQRRKQGKSLQELYADICRLCSLSFPFDTSELSKILQSDFYLSALNNPELRIKILETGASATDDAHQLATKFEAYRVCTEMRDAEDVARPRVRATAAPPDSSMATRIEKLEKAMARVSNTIESFSSQWQTSTVGKRQATASAVEQKLPGRIGGESSYRRGACSANRPGVGERSCYSCGKKGHLKRDCPKRKDGRAETTSTTRPPLQVRSTQVSMEKETDPMRQPMEICIPLQIPKGSSYRSCDGILDTGSVVNIIPKRLVNGKCRPTNIKMTAVNGSLIPAVGETTLQFQAYGMKFYETFVVTSNVDEIILGLPFIHKNDCTINC